jgi:hypothetical protein
MQTLYDIATIVNHSACVRVGNKKVNAKVRVSRLVSCLSQIKNAPVRVSRTGITNTH